MCFIRKKDDQNVLASKFFIVLHQKENSVQTCNSKKITDIYKKIADICKV